MGDHEWQRHAYSSLLQEYTDLVDAVAYLSQPSAPPLAPDLPPGTPVLTGT